MVPMLRGYDPLEDATDYGRELIPLVRAEVARRDAAEVGVAEPGAGAELAGRS
jgi:alkanesulfonate monooxygenase